MNRPKIRFFVNVLPSSVMVELPSSPDGPFADGAREVWPGESYLGQTYEELRALGDGVFEIEQPDPKKPN